QARAHVGVRRGKEPFHAVSSHAVVAITDTPAEFIEVRWSVHAFNDEEIIAAGRCLGKGNHGSGSAPVLTSKPFSKSERFNAFLNPWCSLCEASTLKTNRFFPSARLRRKP